MPRFEYAPAPESRAIVSLRESYGLFIGGEFTSSVDGRAFKTISPATEEVLAEVTEAGPADVDRAVAAARQAYERTWSGLARIRGLRAIAKTPRGSRPGHPVEFPAANAGLEDRPRAGLR